MDTCCADLREAAGRLRLHDQWGLHVGGTWSLLQGNALHLPFGSGVFDAVICSEVLEHIPDDHGVLQEIRRVMKPGTLLAISVPRYFPERICWALSPAYRQSPGGHIRIYRKRELLKRLAQAGFTVRGQGYAHSLHTPYWWLKCLVGPDKTDSPAVRLFHRFLMWDMVQQPAFSRFLDRLLNPVLGKSLILYAVRSGPAPGTG
jgi:SAM-dependent methyltransferase